MVTHRSLLRRFPSTSFSVLALSKSALGILTSSACAHLFTSLGRLSHSFSFAIICTVLAWSCMTIANPLHNTDRFHTVSIAIPPWVNPNANRIWIKQINDRGTPNKLRVRLGSPDDYKALVLKGIANEYDFLILPQHIGLYLWKHHGFHIIASGELDANVVIVSTQPDIQTISDLKHKRIGFPDPIAYVTIAAERFLAGQSLDFETHYLARHDIVLKQVIKGKVDAGAVVEQAFRTLDKPYRSSLNRLHTLTTTSLVLALAKPATESNIQQKMTNTLLDTNLEKLKLFPEWSEFDTRHAKAMYESDLHAVDVIRRTVEAHN